jgi:hypothetical protein
MKALAPRLVLAALAAALVLAAPAAAKDGLSGKKILRADLLGSHPDGPTLNGVKPGGAPWEDPDGRAIAREDGRIRVRFEGLVIPDVGTGPVKTVSASLFCGTSTTPVGTTMVVPLSPAGDAEIEDQIAPPPAGCDLPRILINPNGNVATYIATTSL